MKGRESGMPEDEYWESFFNPGCIVERLTGSNLRGDIVEFGCGYGTFTIPLGRHGGGTVYAIDIEPEMVTETARKVSEAGLVNVVVEHRDFAASGCGRPDASVASAILFNILHIEIPIRLLKEVYRILAPGGEAAIIHWRSDIPTPRGPSHGIRPTAKTCRAWGEEAGLVFDRYESLCCCSWHWGLVMQRI